MCLHNSHFQHLMIKVIWSKDTLILCNDDITKFSFEEFTKINLIVASKERRDVQHMSITCHHIHVHGFIQSSEKGGWQCQMHDNIKGLIAFLRPH